jgi:broad specificity phosphatase PhoE
MRPTAIWLIRHALVEESARAFLYGSTDVPLCETTLRDQGPIYTALAKRLPRPAAWGCTPLSRTRRTAEAIFRAGYPAQALEVVPGLIEQSMGDWHGTRHAEVPAKLAEKPHPFWPLAATERPPGGESMDDVIGRTGMALEDIAARQVGQDVVIVSHGGTIRAAVAHALGISAQNALHLSVHNLGLTILERELTGWRVVCVNETAGY